VLPRWSAAVVAAGAAVVLVAGVVLLTRSDTITTYDEQDEVQAFRSAFPSATAAAAAPTTAPGQVRSAAPSARAASAAPAGPRGAAPAAAAPVARPASSAPAGAAPREVVPGVYRYATEGFEEVDALGGARHDYPATSTVTYSRSGCGTEVRGTFQRREFFGQSQSQTYAGDFGVLVLPRAPRAGQTWTATCTSEDSTARFAVRVVALEDLEVCGTAVPAVRVRLDAELSGSTRGMSDRELWLARADGLLLQATGTTDTDADTDADTAGGKLRYRESYRLACSRSRPAGSRCGYSASASSAASRPTPFPRSSSPNAYDRRK
jgi:hypothetical protein